MQAEQSPLDSGKRPRRLAGKATRPCPVLLPGLAVPQLQSRSGTTETSQLVVGTPCHHNDIAVRCVVSAVTQRVARSPGAGLCVCLGGTSVWSHLSQASLSKQRWRASARGHAAAFAHSLQAAAVANCVHTRDSDIRQFSNLQALLEDCSRWSWVQQKQTGGDGAVVHRALCSTHTFTDVLSSIAGEQVHGLASRAHV